MLIRLRTYSSAHTTERRARQYNHIWHTDAGESQVPGIYGSSAKLTGKAVSAPALGRAAAVQLSHAEHPLLRLQRQFGNRYVQRGMAQGKKADDRGEATPDLERTIERARGGGQALDSEVRAQIEPAFDTDFIGVRVHADAQADTLSRSLNARAFTTGQDIFFRQGAYSPGSPSGQELLAHELTHVVQQDGDLVQTKLTLGQPGDEYEEEADQAARAVMQREQWAVQRQVEEGEKPTDDRNERKAYCTASQFALSDRASTTTGAIPATTVQRAVADDYDTIRSNLSYGLFDWAIRDREARQVLRILETLSDQDLIDTYFQMAADGLWSRFTSNVPRNEQSALSTLQQRINRLTRITELTPTDEAFIRDICLFFFPGNPPSNINSEVVQIALQMVVAAKSECSRLMDIIPRPPSNPNLFWLLRQVGGPLWRRVRREGRIYVACRNTVARNFRSAYEIAQFSSSGTRGVR